MIRKEVGKFSDRKIMKKLSERGTQNREGRQATYEEAVKRKLIRKKKAKGGSDYNNLVARWEKIERGAWRNRESMFK